MSSPSLKPKHLEPSALGTKEYWDSVYASELDKHTADPADEGTVWFSDSSAERKTLGFLATHAAALGLARARARVLDLGCGNGSQLRALRRAGWAGALVGADYSAASVALARRVCAHAQPPVDFRVWDFLGHEPDHGHDHDGRWDLVLDKGTFDAVSLDGHVDGAGRRKCERYRDLVLRLLRPGGVFLVTSCNWTEQELGGWFLGGVADRLEVVGRIEYPTFSFGGVDGQAITTLCFQKKGEKNSS